MKVLSNSRYIFFVGFALFSMFFGAYNLAFPLVMGQQIHVNSLPIALLGSFLSFILFPSVGFYAMALFEGNYREFFGKIGKILGFVVLTIAMLFFGPLGVLSRGITVSLPFVQAVAPSISPSLFALLFCSFLFVCAMNKSALMTLLGKVFAPILFLVLLLVFVYGMLTPVPTTLLEPSYSKPFEFGFFAGYFSMSFVMGILFCYVVVNSMKRISLHEHHVDTKALLKNDLRSMMWAAALLFIISSGLAYTSSKFSSILVGLPADRLLPTLLDYLFHGYGPVLTSFILVLVCFTTSLAFSVVFSDFVRKDLLFSTISYPVSLGLTLLLSYAVSLYGSLDLFYSLAGLMYELLPGILLLALLNIGHKVFNWHVPKAAAIILFFVTLIVARKFV